jgi:DNA-binding response OmpR family regulator
MQTASGPRILIVDDEEQIVEVLERYLVDEGFSVTAALDGDAAVESARSQRPDLIVLDLKLPKRSGLDVFNAVRAESDVPVIILTSRGDEVDRVVGLELGADDYIAKPFSPREVVARVKAVLRRSNGARGVRVQPEELSRSESIAFGDLEISLRDHDVHVAGRAVALTPTEFTILRIMAEQPGRTFTRAQLLDRVRADNLDVYERTLDRHIANLRHKIEPDPGKPRYIETVFGVGYKMPKPT